MTTRKDINSKQETLYNAIQAPYQDVNNSTREHTKEGDTIDPLHYHSLLATARENSITTKFEEEIKVLTAEFEQKINGLQQELLIHRKFGLRNNESIMVQALQEKGLSFNSCDSCLVLLQHCPHARPVEMTSMASRNHQDGDDRNRHLGVPTLQPEGTASAEESTEEHVLFQALKPQHRITNKVPQNLMGPEDPMGPDLPYRAELHEVAGEDLDVSKTPTLTQVPGNFVFHAPQKEGTLDNAPCLDSDYDELPDPNLVWSCQTLRWENNKDRHNSLC